LLLLSVDGGERCVELLGAIGSFSQVLAGVAVPATPGGAEGK